MANASMTPSSERAHAMARGLGWFSIALGAAELFSPRPLGRWLGMRGREQQLQFYGAREIATGIGILTSNNPGPWVWGRVGGDAMDLITLVNGMRYGKKNWNAALALAAVSGVTALDVICAQSLAKPSRLPKRISDEYGRRSGFPEPAARMRGAASDYEAPEDFRTPEPLQAYH